MPGGILKYNNKIQLNVFSESAIATSKSTAEFGIVLKIANNRNQLFGVCKAAVTPFFSTAKETFRPYLDTMNKALNVARGLEDFRSLPDRIWNGASFTARAVGFLLLVPISSIITALKVIIGIIPSFRREIASLALGYKDNPVLFPRTAALHELDDLYTECLNRGSIKPALTEIGHNILQRLENAVADNDHEAAVKLLYIIENRLTPPLIVKGYEDVKTTHEFRSAQAELRRDTADRKRAVQLIHTLRKKREFPSQADFFHYVKPRLKQLAQINREWKRPVRKKTTKPVNKIGCNTSITNPDDKSNPPKHVLFADRKTVRQYPVPPGCLKRKVK